jgi:hypothetical protein
VRAHLCSGAGLPAGLAGWSLLQWVYETLSHAATIDSTLAATASSSPTDTRLPSDLAEQLAQRAAALLWPAAPLTAQQLQLQQEQLAPGALVQRAVAAAAAATTTSSAAPPASATAALQRLAWIVDRHKDALRVVAAVKEQLTGVLTGAGRGLKRKGGKRKSADVAALTSALTQLESVPSVRIVEPVLDAVKSSLHEAQVAAAASAEHSASGENEFYDGHDAGGSSDEGYSDDEDSMQVDTSRSADGLDEEFTVEDDEYGDAPKVNSVVPPRAHATRLGGVHRPLKLDDSDLDLSSSDDDKAAASVAATAAALARAKLSKGSSYKKGPSVSGGSGGGSSSSSSGAKAAGAAAAAERKKSTARVSPFGRLLKVCARCKQAHQGAVKCRVVDKHWADPDWDDDSGVQKWRPPAGFMQWYNSEGAAAYGSGSSKQSSGTPSPRTSAAASSSSKLKPAGASPSSYSSSYGAVIGVQALRPQCLVDGCTRTAAQTSPYCSHLCAAQSGSTVLRALRARREQLVAAGKMPASTAAAAPASAVAPSQTVGGTAAASGTTAAAAAAAAAADGDSMDVDAGAAQSAPGADTLAAAAAAPQPSPAEAAAAAEWQSAVAAALQRLAAGGAAAESDKLLRNRARVRERLESVFAEGLKHFGASPSPTVNQLWAWDLEHQIYKLYPKAKLTEYKVR